MKIVILGGGFGGVSTALNLAKLNLPEFEIKLISDKPHFEYHAALYRVVTGRSPLEVCVPLEQIFAPYRDQKNKQKEKIEIISDRINKIDLAGKILTGQSGSRYTFDYLVIALGSETSYFGISGLPEFSFGFKSIAEALKLKAHLHELFQSCAAGTATGDDKVCGAHLVVVGGGASGVELAGELAIYGRRLAEKHGLEPALVTVDLIEAAPRLLPALPAPVSERVKARLHGLGVNVFLNRVLKREEVNSIELGDMTIRSKTIIWTAGVKTHSLLAGVPGLRFDKKGRVLVDGALRPMLALDGTSSIPNVFVVGDCAATKYSGLASTAARDGAHVARAFQALALGQAVRVYRPEVPFSSIPVGPDWAATVLGSLTLYGYLGWIFRRLADFRYFISILPFRQALLAFGETHVLSESCPVCNPVGQQEFK